MDIWLKIQQYTFHTSSVSKESTTLQVLSGFLIMVK